MSARIPARQRVEHTVVDGAHTAQLTRLAIEAEAKYGEEKQARGTSQRVGSQPVSLDERESIKTADAFDALYSNAEIVYTLQAFPRREWDEVKEQHPPRWVPSEDDPEKMIPHDHDTIGVNARTFFPAVLHKTIVDPDSDPYDPKPLLTERECEDLADSVTAVQWKSLCDDIWGLNEWGAGIPRLSMGSLLRRTIDAESQQRETSESPSPALRVGSPASSTPTETATETPAPSQTPGAPSSSESLSGTVSSAT